MLSTNQLKATSIRAVRCKLSFPQIISIIRGARGVKKTSGEARKVLTELQAVLFVQLVLLLHHHQGVDSAQTTSMHPTEKLTVVV